MGVAVGAGVWVGFGVEVAAGRRVTVGSITTVGVGAAGAVGGGAEQALSANRHKRSSRKAVCRMVFDRAALYFIRNNSSEI